METAVFVLVYQGFCDFWVQGNVQEALYIHWELQWIPCIVPTQNHVLNVRAPPLRLCFRVDFLVRQSAGAKRRPREIVCDRTHTVTHAILLPPPSISHPFSFFIFNIKVNRLLQIFECQMD